MQKYFELRPSQTELTLVYAILLLTAVFTLIYLEHGIVQSIFLLAIVLLGFNEWQVLRRSQKQYLVVDDRLCGVTTVQGEQPYFSSKNKVYRCRWFAILKLFDRHKNRTEILFPDRFKSLQAYQECRFLLNRLQDS